MLRSIQGAGRKYNQSDFPQGQEVVDPWQLTLSEIHEIREKRRKKEKAFLDL